jgi:hypothetical protein
MDCAMARLKLKVKSKPNVKSKFLISMLLKLRGEVITP